VSRRPHACCLDSLWEPFRRQTCVGEDGGPETERESENFWRAALRFIANERDLGDTLIQLAITEYEQGRPERGDEVVAKVKRAREECEHRLSDLEVREWDVANLRDGLRALTARAADLEAQVQKGSGT